jgi:DNA-binding response OmpR family regulator
VARIAVVEDHPDLLLATQQLLGLRGYDVVPFPDGMAALNALRQGGFDIVITDVQMPHLDGVSLCRALRQFASKTQLPVVIVSGLDSEDDILRGLDAGANDYMVKPASTPMLYAKVAQLLRQKEEVPAAGPPVSSLVPGAPLPTFPFTFDRYVVEGEVARGGMSVVYRATHRVDGRAVALKVLDPEVTSDRRGLARFFREAGALATISSPRVVGVVGSGFEQGRYFLAMEMVEGLSARSVLTSRGPLPEVLGVRVALDMVEALQALKAKRLVHRDIKPGNVIIRRDGRATLVDLGLVKGEKDDDVTHTNLVMGTPQYLAPEVFLGRQATSASDVYALGVTLYEVLTARRPYGGRDPSAVVLEKVGTYRPPAVGTVRTDLSPAFAAVVDQMMEHDPRHRLADLVALRVSLSQLRAA